MATLSVVATVELNNHPPRVKIVVTDTGSPNITSVTVTRTDPSGVVVPVRTDSGAALALVTSGSNRVGTLYDYEMPYGQPVVYSTTQQPSVTATVTAAEERVWLVHPGVPARSQPIELMKGSFDEEDETVEAGVFYPIGRREAVVVSDGRRKAPAGTLIVQTETSAERRALADLLADAFPMLLNVPPSVGIDVDTAYVHIGTLRRTRPSDVGTSPLRNWVLPFQVVAMPIGGAQSLRTFQDVLDEHATFQAVLDAYATFADMQAPTS